jgi:CheY-like chemotaxis protein
LFTFAQQRSEESRPVDINQSVRTVTDLLKGTMDKRVALELDLDRRGPVVRGDPSRFEQIILNLSVNALDAMPEGGELKILTESAHLGAEFCKLHPGMEPGPHIRLSVTDTGTGMDQNVLSRIFDPFFTTKETGKGTGLGLSVVYGIVKNHAGAIEVASRPGEGTRFDVYLPAAQKTKAVEAEAKTAPAESGKCILVADDEDMVRDYVVEALEGLGYRTQTARNGREALDVFGRHKSDVDLILLDVNMPLMSGREACRELRRIRSDVRILVTTGLCIEDEARQFLKEGAKDFLQKPFTVDRLSAKVAEVLTN